MHARIDEDVYAKTPRDVKPGRYCQLTRRNQRDTHSESAVARLSTRKMRHINFDRSDLNPSVYRDPDLDLIGEKHGADFFDC